MPAGVSMPRYLAFFAASMLSMFAGAQVVHHYYKPLENLDKAIEKEWEKQRKQIHDLELEKKN